MNDPKELFARCNYTELYQIARDQKLAVTPTATREELISLIVDEAVPPEGTTQIDAWRRGIMRFLAEHRRKLETQLACPAAVLYRDPPGRPAEEVVMQIQQEGLACFGCTDARVLYCLTTQTATNRQLIQLKKR